MYLLLAFIPFLIMGLPIAFVIGLTSLFFFLIKGIPLVILVNRMFDGVDSFILLTIPLFILAGNIMNAGGMTDRLIRFSKLLIGRTRGGLALVNIVASMFFAGITGAAVADTAAIGSILIPAMNKEGYNSDFSGAVTATSSTIGPIIPPSIPMIIYGVISGCSIGALFLAGIVPGILLGIFQMILVYSISCKRDYPRGEKRSPKELWRGLKDAGLSMMTPVIILGGILTGVFTVTEAAAVAVFYTLFVSIFIYRTLKLSQLFRIFINAAITSSVVILIISISTCFGWILATQRAPQIFSRFISGLTSNPLLALLLINLLLLFMGTFLETTASLYILTPILLPLVKMLGIDLIHFGAIMILNLVIGLTTPPLGVCLFVASSISKDSVEKLSKAILPFIGISIIVLLITTYCPKLIMFLPHIYLKTKGG